MEDYWVGREVVRLGWEDGQGGWILEVELRVYGRCRLVRIILLVLLIQLFSFVFLILLFLYEYLGNNFYVFKLVV